jgi:predicted nucleic acid-binding protein
MIDILAQRQPFYVDAAKIITLAEQQKIKLVASSVSFVNTFYVLAKTYEKPDLLKALTNFRILCEVSNVDEINIDKSLHSDFSDFEDAVQYYSALHHNCNVFVTRNKKDFKKTEISLMTPSEFLISIKRK